MNMSIVGHGKACGKFILMGEHFIVNGDTPALAFPLHDLWCEVSIRPSSVKRFEAAYAGIKGRFDNEEQIKSLMNRSTIAAADALRMNLSSQPLHVQSRANFPVSRGFGSSASFSIALARALMDFRVQIDNEWQLTDPVQEIEKAANTIEKIFHGTPSGVDTAVILNDKPIKFVKDETTTKSTSIVNRACDFILLDGGTRDQCINLVANVSNMKLKEKLKWARLSEQMGTCIQACETALSTRNGSGIIGETVSESHRILSEIGLTTENVDSIISKAKSFGALSGKISGAGGGGAVVIVTKPGESDRIAKLLTADGCDVLAISRAWIEST